ncbi:MAG: molybdate ABC transporter permease subunit [Syntrophobacteraceae bacterium]
MHDVLHPLLLTLKVASLATLFAFLLGTAMAALIVRYRFPGREFLDAVLTLPLVMPPTVLGYYIIVVLGRKGWIGQWLNDTFGISLMFTWQGAVVASVTASLPLVFKSARAAFETVDQNLEKAARTLGSSEIEVFLRVSLPLAWRGLLAGTMLAFARGMGEFGATLMVAGNLPGKTQTLSLAVYSAVQAGNDAMAALLVAIISAVCICVLLGSGKALKSDYMKEVER